LPSSVRPQDTAADRLTIVTAAVSTAVIFFTFIAYLTKLAQAGHSRRAAKSVTIIANIRRGVKWSPAFSRFYESRFHESRFYESRFHESRFLPKPPFRRILSTEKIPTPPGFDKQRTPSGV
jgi:hypothetical protein